MHLGQRRHLYGVVGDERWLNERALAELSEEFVDELSLAHCLVYLHALLLAELAYLVFRLAVAVEARLLLYGIEDRQTAIGSLERYYLSVDLSLGLAVHSRTDGLEQLLGERHHPVVVLILHIELHAGELRVVVAVHTLVAEVLANLVDSLETAHDKPLQIELGSYTHIHLRVERVEMGYERTSRSTSGYRLQGWSLHLGVARLVEHAAHGAYHGGALEECVLHSLVHHQVHIAAAVAQLGVVELVVGHSVLVFHDGQGLERLRQQGQLLGVNAYFAGLRAEHKALHAYEIAYVKQAFEHLVIQVFVLAGTQVVARHIHLYAPFGVL